MNIEIRKAELSDLDLLLKWRMTVLREVFSIPADHPTEDLERENCRYYQTALPAGTHIACFACAGHQIVGCGGVCIYQEMPSPDNPDGRCAYLMNIYTRPDVRKQGIGETIINWLVGQATQQNISKIYLETSDAGKKLYEKMGFTPMLDMLKWPIYERKAR